jgi:mannosyltransferase
MSRKSEGPRCRRTRLGAAADGLHAAISEDRSNGKLGVKLLGVIAAITVAGAALRFATLSQSVWFDEAGTIINVGGSLAHVFTTVSYKEVAPPLYFVCLWIWRHIFGTSAVDMRALSALAGTLTIPVVFAVADRLVQRRAAVVTTVLVAANPVMLYYSQELRMYSLLVLLCALGLLAFLVTLRTPTRRNLCLWTVVSLLAMATHYFAALAVLPQAALLLLDAWRRQGDRRSTAFAAGATVVALLPLAALLVHQYGRAYSYLQQVLTSPFVFQPFTARTASGNIPAQIEQQVLIGPGGPWKGHLAIVVLLVFMVSVVLLFRLPAPRLRAAEFALTLTVPGMLMTVVFLAFHVGLEGRYLLPLAVPAAVVIGCGLGSAESGKLGLAATALICGVWLLIGISSATMPTIGGREDTRGAARALGVAGEGRLIAIDQRWDLQPLQEYLPSARVYGQRRAQITELDVVAMPLRGFPSGSDANRPLPPRLSGLPRGLRLKRIIWGASFVIERYIASPAVSVRISPAAGTFASYWHFLYEPRGGRISSL